MALETKYQKTKIQELILFMEKYSFAADSEKMIFMALTFIIRHVFAESFDKVRQAVQKI